MGMGILVASRSPCLEHKGFVLTAKIREGCSAASVCTEHGMDGVVCCGDGETAGCSVRIRRA